MVNVSFIYSDSHIPWTTDTQRIAEHPGIMRMNKDKITLLRDELFYVMGNPYNGGVVATPVGNHSWRCQVWLGGSTRMEPEWLEFALTVARHSDAPYQETEVTKFNSPYPYPIDLESFYYRNQGDVECVLFALADCIIVARAAEETKALTSQVSGLMFYQFIDHDGYTLLGDWHGYPVVMNYRRGRGYLGIGGRPERSPLWSAMVHNYEPQEPTGSSPEETLSKNDLARLFRLLVLALSKAEFSFVFKKILLEGDQVSINNVNSFFHEVKASSMAEARVGFRVKYPSDNIDDYTVEEDTRVFPFLTPPFSLKR